MNERLQTLLEAQRILLSLPAHGMQEIELLRNAAFHLQEQFNDELRRIAHQ